MFSLGPCLCFRWGYLVVSGSGGFGPLRSGWEMGGPSVGIVWWLPFFRIKVTLMVSTWWGWGIWAAPIGSVENPTPILLHARL